MRHIAQVAWAIFGICWLAAFSQRADPDQRGGRQIYFEGSGSSGTPITATLGGSNNPIPATAVSCVNCHGRSGRGKAEGGIRAADIRWAVLTKPYEVVLGTGRRRGPYTEHDLRRAITMGFDPSGNVIAPAMPRFQMSQQDLGDLVSYLKTLGSDSDPGLSDEEIRIGVVLPPAQFSEMRQAVRLALGAYSEELNRQGGIFGRRMVLCFLDYPEAGEERADKIRNLLETQNLFAVTSSFIVGDEAELTALFERVEIPLVVAFASQPQIAAIPSNRYVFYLDAGVSGQMEALAAFAARRSRSGHRRSAVVYFENGPSRELAEVAKQSLKTLGFGAPTRIALSSAEDLNGAFGGTVPRKADLVFLLAPSPEVLRVLPQWADETGRTMFLIPGSLLRPDSLNSLPRINAHIFLGGFSSQRRLRGTAVAEYRRLTELYHLPSDEISEQWAALAAAEILVAGLAQSGRDLDREILVRSLEELTNFDTGFVAPVSYGPNRRVGNSEVPIFELDPTSRTLIPAGVD
jgi:ABC-type branched-subunit amino acid transport system substrate-binding protein